MSFTILQKNATITATDVNNNFYHIGQGNMMPHGGLSLDETTSAYNLGSDQYRWNNANINNIYADTANISLINGHYYLLDSYTIDTLHTATSRIEFDTSGYNYRFLEFSIYIVDCSTNAYLYPSGDSSASFGTVYVYYSDTGYYIGTITSFIICPTGETSTANCSYSRIIYQKVVTISGDSGDGISLSRCVTGCSDPYARQYFILCGNANTSLNTTTSLVFTGEFNTGASIKIWGIL